MNTTIFTLAEANEALPLVASITRDVVARTRAVEEATRALEHLRGARDQGLPVSASVVDRKDVEVARDRHRLRRLIEELRRLGCVVADPSRGAIEFPAAEMDENGFCYYCWLLGETRVAWRRSDGDEFAERRAIAGNADGPTQSDTRS